MDSLEKRECADDEKRVEGEGFWCCSTRCVKALGFNRLQRERLPMNLLLGQNLPLCPVGRLPADWGTSSSVGNLL